MYTDCCFERKSANKDGKKTVDLKSEMELNKLFEGNTKIPIICEFYKYSARLPKSGLGTKAVERLKIEFRFLKHMFGLVGEGELDKAKEMFELYYSK